MENLSKSQKDEIHMNDVFKYSKLNESDFNILFKDLANNGYIEPTRLTIDLDSIEWLPDFRITNKGANFMKNQRKLIISNFMNEFKNWLALFIALAAFIKSFYF